MTSNQHILEYLNTNTFIPHKNGNYGRYGLNLFGCNSVIQYNNQIWKFKYFISDTNNALYINKEGMEFVLDTYDKDCIIRMQEE